MFGRHQEGRKKRSTCRPGQRWLERRWTTSSMTVDGITSGGDPGGHSMRWQVVSQAVAGGVPSGHDMSEAEEKK
jgi:hypothetical protein